MIEIWICQGSQARVHCEIRLLFFFYHCLFSDLEVFFHRLNPNIRQLRKEWEHSMSTYFVIDFNSIEGYVELLKII